MAYVLENKAYIILNTFLSSSEFRRGQGFFSFTATSTELHLTFCVRGTKERHISLRTPSILHSCGRVCPWKIQEWQADRLAIYLPKTQPTPLVHIRDDSRLACLRTPTFCGHLCPDRLLPRSRPTAKGRWMVLWADKVPVSHKADGSGAWPLLQLPSSPSSWFPYPYVLLFIWSHFQTPGSQSGLTFLLALPGECACSPSFSLVLSCLWFYFRLPGRSVPHVGCGPLCLLSTRHGCVAGSIALSGSYLKCAVFYFPSALSG